MFTLRFACFAIAILQSVNNAWAEPPKCAIRKFKEKDVSQLESTFKTNFCSDTNKYSCDKRWLNGSFLLQKMKSDTRILNTGTASYMFATVYVETGVRNFSPSTVEIRGKHNEKENYMKQGYFGRGWIQLTHKDKYKIASDILKIDLLGNPDLALEKDISYEILFNGMNQGWIEKYRSTEGGGAGKISIKLGDFVSDSDNNYGQARAVINANCRKIIVDGKRKCRNPNKLYKGKGFLPSEEDLDSAGVAAQVARKFERMICTD